MIHTIPCRTNFFGSVRPIEITSQVVNVSLPLIMEETESDVVVKLQKGLTYSDLKIKFNEQFPTNLFK